MQGRNELCCAIIGSILLISFGRTVEAADVSSPAAEAPDAYSTSPAYLDNTIVNPAEEMRRPGATSQPANEGGLTHAWELPPVNVLGASPLREEQRVGTYGQPVWTTDRRFAETRVYVRPEGSLEAEYWYIPTVNRKGPTDFESQFEVEIGLPGRFQVDLYLNPNWVGSGGPTYLNEAIEVRYALADWGKIWGNPTLYLEYTKQDHGPDQLESKILFGGEIAPRYHWGWDLTYQRDMGGDNANTYETTAGLSYTLLDNRFDLGGEFKLQMNEFRGSRGHFHDETFLGPSLQFRPIPRMHVDVAPLIGLTHETPGMQLYIVFGWEF